MSRPRGTKKKAATRKKAGTRAGSLTPQNPRGLKDIPFALPQVSAAEKRRARRLADVLAEHYPEAHCELDFRSPHELLVATILSAQATDVGVNKATPALFERFPTPAAYAAASPEEIEPYIRSLGFFRSKSRAVFEAMREVHETFGGEVPQTMDELLGLRGVARKTANVVLGNAYGSNVGFVVDTHIERLSKRFCLVDAGANVQQIERRLMALFPRERWCALSHQLIWHGRRACTARGKGCAEHPVCRAFGDCCDRRSAAGPGGGTRRTRSAAKPGRSAPRAAKGR